MYNFFVIITFFISCFFIFSILGQNVTQLFSKKKEIKLIEFYPIIGLGFFSILCTTFYISFDINIINIRTIVYFLIILLIINNIFFSKNIKKILKNFFKLLLQILPIIFFFILISLIYGENFYVFRGNYYDVFTQLSQALVFEKNNFSNLSDLLNSENFNQQDFSGFNDQLLISEYTKTHYNFSLSNLYMRPFNALILAFFFNFKYLDLFQINLALKILFISLNFLSVKALINNIFDNRSYFYKILPYIFIFSFWSFYNFEIDALGHLTSLCFFWASISLMIYTYKEKKIDLITSIYFVILLSSLLITYPTFFFIISLLILFVLFHLKKFFIKNIKRIFYIAIGFVISSGLLLPYFINISLGETGSPDYWTYFGAFILGRESIVLDEETVQLVKLVISSDMAAFDKLYQIVKINFNEGYIFIPINIITSFFGFYFLTPGNVNNSISYFLFVLSVIIIFFLYQNLKHSIKIIFIKEEKKHVILNKVIIFYIIFSFLLLISGKFYGLIKIYFFFSPFIFLISFGFINKMKDKNFIIFMPLVLCIVFPIYKYSEYNFGINRLDSFPSIISKYQKQNIKWKINKNNLICDKYLIDNSDFYNALHYNNRILADGYVSLYIDFFKKKEVSKNYLLNKVCEIKFQKGKFLIINN